MHGGGKGLCGDKSPVLWSLGIMSFPVLEYGVGDREKTEGGQGSQSHSQSSSLANLSSGAVGSALCLYSRRWGSLNLLTHFNSPSAGGPMNTPFCSLNESILLYLNGWFESHLKLVDVSRV